MDNLSKLIVSNEIKEIIYYIIKHNSCYQCPFQGLLPASLLLACSRKESSGLRHAKMSLWAYADSEGPDQPAHHTVSSGHIMSTNNHWTLQNV